MNENIQRLQDERNKVWEEAKALLDTAQAESRDLSAEENAKYETLTGVLDENQRTIANMIDAEKRSVAMDEARADYERIVRPGVSNVNDERSEADKLRDFVLGESRSNVWTANLESRDLTVGTTTAGGHTVPQGFNANLYQVLVNNSTIRQTNVQVITTASGEDMKFPVADAHPSAYLVTEGATISESDGTFDAVTLGAYKYARLVQVSSELLKDTGVDIVSYLSTALGRAVANASGADFVSGDGSSKPDGVMHAASTGETTATNSAITPEELINLQHSVIAGYRKNAYWLMKDSTAAYIRKLRWASGEAFIWQPAVIAGQPDVLFGSPVLTDPNVAAIAAEAEVVAYGDFSGYTIREVAGVEVVRSDDYAFNADLVTFRVTYRADGDLLDAGAIKTLSMHS